MTAARWWIACSALLACSMSLAWTLLALAADPPKAKKPKKEKPVESVFSVDPTGQPQMEPKDGTRIYVWVDSSGWHLRTRSKGAVHTFSGEMLVTGGKIRSLAAVDGLEIKGKGADQGWVSPDRRTIKFEFATKRGRNDGFDFTIDGGVKQIAFQLKVDGAWSLGAAVIGGKETPAPNEIFTINVPGKE